ncbi:MAG TPA: hypothetical protein VIP11_02060, partial [Gemmatimonadaceae bacterium]
MVLDRRIDRAPSGVANGALVLAGQHCAADSQPLVERELGQIPDQCRGLPEWSFGAVAEVAGAPWHELKRRRYDRAFWRR